ncbi:MAG: transglutaminaseTgpA domain-containing protein [Candidatus Obscuribacterales bacterium]|nr:transglutaminaseTgpA domain-containing protein [Candidatus Obscuribacterales bacterium]
MKKAKTEKYIEPPEDSVALRITNALIAIACITVACIYAELPLFQTFLYVWFAITGCYTSYYFRHGKHLWLTASIIGGLLFVVFLFARDLLQEFNIGHLENFAPFLSVIAGMQTVHTFDLQTRSDINVSTVLSLFLFTMTAVIGRDLLFGFFVMALVVLGSALLYFEAVARTKSNQGSTQLSQTEVITPFPTQSRRMASGSAVLPIAALPVLTVILFACLPRVDSVVDVLFAKFHPSPIKVDDKGFNFMSGTGNGPGKGKSGSGSNNQDAKADKKENKEQNKFTDDSAQKNASGNGGTKNSATSSTASTASQSASTSTESKNLKDGKDAKKGATDKNQKNGAAAINGKTKDNDKSGKDDKNGKKGSRSGASADGSDGKKENEKPNPNGQAGNSGKGDKRSDDQNNQAGGSSGKGKRHGAGGGVGDSSDETGDDAQKKERLQSQNLTESDELIFRNKDTAEFDDSVFMTVRSDQPVYLKRTVFDKYDGKHWLATVKMKPAICEKSESGWTELGGVPQLFVPSEQKTTTVLQVITADIGLGRIIPAASVPQRVDLSSRQSGSISVDDYGVLRSNKDISPGTVFKIESKIPTFDIKKMHEAERDAAKEKEILEKEALYLQLPDGLPAEIKKLTQEIVIADDNFFNRADRICKHLRSHYKYSSDVYQGSESNDLVSNFLFKKKEGACGEFSSAFVVMCRLAGIPARCVGGYGPGTPDGRTGRREVCGLDGHAWGEVCIPNVGWVPFDATPTGTMPVSESQDNSWFSILRRNFDQAEAAFQSSQQDRNLGKGSEDDYKAAPEKAKPSEIQKRANSNKRNNDSQPAQPSQNAKDNAKEPKKKNKQDDAIVSPLGRSSTEAETEGLKPTENGKIEKVENKSFILSWQAIALALTLIPGGFLIVKLGLARFRRRARDNRSTQGVTPSTALYLKMTEDLKRLKVLRRPSDTTDELTRRFSEIVEADERIHPDLEELFKQFIELYSQERFSEQGHNTENYKQLREIGNRIHTLSKTRLEKQRN